MINNFEVIDNFLNFENGYFYKFEALVRNTDGDNPLYYEGCSNVNKNILIKNWYVDNVEYYNRCKKEMIELCNMTGARLYITLDRKENKKLLITMFNTINDMVAKCICNDVPSLRKMGKMMASCSSVIDSSEHKSRTIMFDVDSKSTLLLDSLANYIQKNGQKPYVLETVKGYHLFCYKKFDSNNWEQDSLQFFYEIYKYQLTLNDLERLTYLLRNEVSLKSNALGLVYMGDKE